MARLPVPSSDDGTWGQILNDFLAVSLSGDGTIKAGVITESNLSPAAQSKLNANTGIPPDGSVTEAKLDSAAQAKLNSGGVASVNTRTGAVTLTKTDVGLANADNTSDANKPVSTATQTALNLKANDNAVVHNTGAETVAGVKTFSSSPIVPTPGSGTAAANKTYVDTAVAGAGGGAGVGSATPSALGTAAAGSSTSASHEDHVHPTTGLTLATGGGVEGLSNVSNATGATSLNLANGNVFNVTLTGNVTFSFTGATNNKACSFTLYVSQNGAGNHNIIWPGGVLWAGGTIPTPSLSGNTVDIYVFESISGGTVWFGAMAGANYH